MSRQVIFQVAAIALMATLGGTAQVMSDKLQGSAGRAGVASWTGSPATRTSAGSCDALNGRNADCNGNGVVDTCDIDSGSSTDCDINGVPDEES